MQLRTPVPTSHVMDHTSPVSTETTPTTAVLDRVAARVQQRLAAEQTAASRTGDGSHSASLILPWPL
ncbi:HaaA family cyclophane-containing RiPP peptide [Streptomyces flaveus]|nr:HaaA family cyclophane-containing RiPP peptide [Streptomyces flaveus]